MSVSVGWIPTVLLGPGATILHLVLMGRGTVMMIANVVVHFSVAMTFVLADQ